MLEACDDRAEVFERRVVVRDGGPVFVSAAVGAGLSFAWVPPELFGECR